MDINSTAKPRPPSCLHSTLLACSITAVFIAALLVTVTLNGFHVREPMMTMNAIALKGFDATALASCPVASLRLTVVADVSVANPNAVSLRYRRSETSVYYRAQLVGEASGPPATACARRTVRLNVTVDVAIGALVGHPGFLGDAVTGGVVVTTATRVRVRASVLGGVVRRHVVLEMNCTATIIVADRDWQQRSSHWL